ncbi:MAG: esterase-like activity of phytase family protein [Halobacteriovoraceae bacterium]|jgi:hypothetical protein|nr:esterase-like activity of phytase family protein [Halobacteriovoraceae bacterium]
MAKLCLLLTFLLLASCATNAPKKIKELRYIGSINYKTSKSFKGLQLGGLSGLVYDKKTKRLLAISDDRGKWGKPRYYSFKFFLTSKKFKLRTDTLTFLKNNKGKKFKDGRRDFEGITLLRNNHLVLSSEGNTKKKPRIPPALTEFDKKGNFVRELNVPIKFLPEPTGYHDTGVRNNLGLESLSSTPNGGFLFFANEAPLKQDDRLSTTEYGGDVRLVRYKASGSSFQPDGEFVYQVEPIPVPDLKKKLRGSIGLTDLLALDENRLISIERAWVRKLKKQTIRLYSVEIERQTSNVKNEDFLHGKFYKRVKKKLLADLDSILPLMPKKWRKLDNIEGICLGPRLKNGNYTLILVSDNNFNARQRTLFMAFEIIEKKTK